MQGLEFSEVLPYWSVLVKGTLWTIVLTTSSIFLSLLGGMVFALFRLTDNKWLSAPVQLFRVLLMGTPLLLQLFLVYFGLVQIGIDLPALLAGILALSLHYAVYNADIFGAGIAAVEVGQTESARSIGFSWFQTMRYVVIPQAVRNTMPAIGGGLIALLKDSAVVSVIGVNELIQGSQRAISETFRPFEFYVTAAIIYYLLNLFLEAVLRATEKKVELTR